MDRLGYMAAACGRYPSAYWDNGSFQMLHSGRSRKPTMKKGFPVWSKMPIGGLGLQPIKIGSCFKWN